MSWQVISETCGIAVYKGGGRSPSVFGLGEPLVRDKKPPVTLIILIMVNKAFHLVITTFIPAFGKPLGGPEKGFTPALWTRNLRLKRVSAYLQLPIHIHTQPNTVLPHSRHNFKGTFPQGEDPFCTVSPLVTPGALRGKRVELGVSVLCTFALADANPVSFFQILWFLSALVGNAQPICLKFLNEALGLFFPSLNVVRKC